MCCVILAFQSFGFGDSFWNIFKGFVFPFDPFDFWLRSFGSCDADGRARDSSGWTIDYKLAIFLSSISELIAKGGICYFFKHFF